MRGILVFFAVAISALAIAISYTSDCGPAPVIADGSVRMKAISYRCYGSPDILEYADIEKPTPADDEVLVKVHAAGVNPLDVAFMRGEPYLLRLGAGLGTPDYTRLGVDFAGTVEAVGKNVTRFKPGDEIYGGGDGAFAEYVILHEDRGIALKPANLTFEQAASVPIAGITALQVLRDLGKVKPGQKVLINGASGGVGTFAVQIAKSYGAEVTGVCSTRNEEMVRSIGADHVIDYKTENYTESGKQYDLIVDNVGNHSLIANRKVLTPDGMFVIVGGKKSKWLEFFMRPIMGVIMSAVVDQQFVLILANITRDDLLVLAKLMQDGKVTPVIDRSYQLSEVPDAIAYSAEGHARGKIVIKMD